MRGLSLAVLYLISGSDAVPVNKQDKAFLEMDIGGKMSTLGLSILSKNTQHQNVEHSIVPNIDLISVPDEQLVLVKTHSNQDSLTVGDINENDMLAYSAMNTDTEDTDIVFSNGGAIMDALEQANPGIKQTLVT